MKHLKDFYQDEYLPVQMKPGKAGWIWRVVFWLVIKLQKLVGFKFEIDPDHIKILADIVIPFVASNQPDEIIGPKHDPYLKRWYLRRTIGRGRVYLHQILRSDDDRALHDHPWDSTSIVLDGKLTEILEDSVRILEPGQIVSRSAEESHRLVLDNGEVWSLFITGPKRREWGFHTASGWQWWRNYVKADFHKKTTKESK